MMAELESQPRRWSSESAQWRPDRGRVGARRAAAAAGRRRGGHRRGAAAPARPLGRRPHDRLLAGGRRLPDRGVEKKELTPAGHEAAVPHGRLRAQRRARVDEAALPVAVDPTARPPERAAHLEGGRDPTLRARAARRLRDYAGVPRRLSRHRARVLTPAPRDSRLRLRDGLLKNVGWRGHCRLLAEARDRALGSTSRTSRAYAPPEQRWSTSSRSCTSSSRDVLGPSATRLEPLDSRRDAHRCLTDPADRVPPVPRLDPTATPALAGGADGPLLARRLSGLPLAAAHPQRFRLGFR